MTDELTREARSVLDDYLERVRARLGDTDLDAAEVVDDIRDHVAAATAGGSGPAAADEVRRVLADLGPPDRWAPGAITDPSDGSEARSTGADGIRWMAILVFLATVAGVATFPWTGPIGLLAAWVLARATVSRARAVGPPLGPWKWLVVPPLALFAGALLLVLMVAPIGPLAEVPLDLPRWAIVVAGLALWYGLLALVGLRFRPAVRWLLFPRLDARSGHRR